jgi:hypothetical protein
VRESLFVNTLGHGAGTLVFGIFLVLLLGDRTRARAKSALAAALALGWNLASLLVLAGAASELVVAAGFTAISLLPALLFDLSLREGFRAIVPIGYGLSLAATGLHIAELFSLREGLHRWGLLLITVGFGLLTVAAAGVLLRAPAARGAFGRLASAMALFLFALSFVHLDEGHGEPLWARELAFHHAGIPLALMVLLQDHRFLLLDAFLRFLLNIAFAAAAVVGGYLALARYGLPGDPFGRALFLLGACLALIGFAAGRAALQRLLTRMVFRRADPGVLVADLESGGGTSSAPEYLAWAAERIAGFFEAAPVRDAEAAAAAARLRLTHPVLRGELERLPEPLSRAGVEVLAPLGDTVLLLGRRRGGRRYLSEDLALLLRCSTAVRARLDRLHEAELRRLVSEAELRALQSQIHPHFLFNALNTLYGIIPREARGARETVLNLGDIFRYFLRPDKRFLPLGEEMRIVRAYLAIEQLRLGDRLRIDVDVPGGLLEHPIPALSVQPLVENAVKHGVAPKPEGGAVRVSAFAEAGSLVIEVADSGAGFAAESGAAGAGVGLDNVTRRLRLCYGEEAALRVTSGPAGSTVSFRIPAARLAVTR